MPELIWFRALMGVLGEKIRAGAASERGSVTLEQVLWSVTLAAVALATGAVIAAKIADRAQSIPTGTP